MRVAGVGRPFALDHTAVMLVGAALGTDPEILADVLPSAEAAIIAHLIADDLED